MIQDCRIYTPDGKLKEVLPGAELSRQFWERAALGVESEQVIQARREGNATRNRGRKASSESLKVVRRMVDWMASNTPPDGRTGWTVSELLKAAGVEPTDSAFKQGSTLIRNASRAAYGGFPVARKRAGGGNSRVRYEYFLEVE